MSIVLSKGEIDRFKKDNNNNLDNNSCLDFIKLYENSNGKISSVINPITNRKIKDTKRIKFIYEKCLGHFNSKTSPVKDKKVLDKLPKPVKDKKVLDKLPKPVKDKKVLDKLPKPVKDKKVLDKLPKPVKDNKDFSKLTSDDVIKIIEEPMMNTNDISEITEEIFGKDNKVNKLSLKKYLEDEDIEVCKIYRNCILEIKKYIKDFCPFMGNKKFTKSVKKHIADECIFEHGIVIFSSKVKNIFNMILPCIIESITHSTTNDTSQDFKNNLKNNFPKHYSIKYMLNVFDRYSISSSMIEIDNLCIMLDELINYDKLIIKNKRNNLLLKIDERPNVDLNNDEMLHTCIRISYKLNDAIDVELFKVFISNKFKKNKALIIKEYTFEKLFDTIQTLLSEGKLLGKSMPYKMHRSLHRYRDKILNDEEEYINFSNLYYNF